MYGEAQPRGSTTYPFGYHFEGKAAPFVYVSLKKVALSLTYFRTRYPFLSCPCPTGGHKDL